MPDWLFDREHAEHNGPYLKQIGLPCMALAPGELGHAHEIESAN
jgi:hypothetical protein